MKKKRGKIFLVFCILIGIALILTAVYLTKFSNRQYDVLEKISEAVIKQREKTKENAPEEAVDNPIDFAELHKTNEDVSSWILIPDKNVNNPILYAGEQYYIRRGFDEEYSYAGSLFVENEYNSRDYNDPVTIVYGHQMQDGTMFSRLEEFLSEPLTDSSEFVIYTEKEMLTYRIFAAVQYSSKHILRYNNFSNKKIFDMFFKEIFEARDFASNVDNSVNIEQGNITILSTCSLESSEKRFLVMGVCVKTQPCE